MLISACVGKFCVFLSKRGMIVTAEINVNLKLLCETEKEVLGEKTININEEAVQWIHFLNRQMANCKTLESNN